MLRKGRPYSFIQKRRRIDDQILNDEAELVSWVHGKNII